MFNSKEDIYTPNQIVSLSEAIKMLDSELHFTYNSIGFNLIDKTKESWCQLQFGSTLGLDGEVEYFVIENNSPLTRIPVTLLELEDKLSQYNQESITCERISSIN